MVKIFWVSLRNSIVKFLNIFIRFQVASYTSLGEQNLHLHTLFGSKLIGMQYMNYVETALIIESWGFQSAWYCKIRF